MTNIIHIQTRFRQELPEVVGNVDYQEFRSTLLGMEVIISKSGLDRIVLDHELIRAETAEQQHAAKSGQSVEKLSHKRVEFIRKFCMQGVRLGVARHLLGESYRKFSSHLADSPLLQRFCLIDNWEKIKVPTKSSLQRYDQAVPEELIRAAITQLTESASEAEDDGCPQRIGLNESLSLNDYYIDSTCLKANIHFPVDWVLLRDAVRTLMKAVILIREQGLKSRMADPKSFISTMNKYCINMTHTRRKKDSRRKRKAILRLMKKISRKVMRHGEKHRKLLADRWQETDLTDAQAAQILNRIDNILSKLPEAINQAHERIIGGRQVKSKDKILSLYEDNIHVISRGKSGAEVEFGNVLFLGEQEDGLIVDWNLHKENASDKKILKESINRIEVSFGKKVIGSVTSDRGFDSSENNRFLEEKKIKSYLCPCSVSTLKERLKDDDFREHQTRRAQTEGRVGILKNLFLGKPLRTKGFASRELHVGWGVLAHNLWVLAKIVADQEKQKKKVS